MKMKKVFLYSIAALAVGYGLSPDAHAQQRDRNRGDPAMEDDRGGPDRGDARGERRGNRDVRGERRGNRDVRGGRRGNRDARGERRGNRDARGARRGNRDAQGQRNQRDGRDNRAVQNRRDDRDERGGRDRRGQRDGRDDRRRAAPPPRRPAARGDRDRRRAAPAQRRRYERRAERRWHRGGHPVGRNVYVPRRWAHRSRPHHRRLWNRHYGRVWWCDFHCRIGLLFGFTVWTTHTVLSYDSSYSFPIWETLEYNRTGETSLWESGWGYVEFTPTRTFRRRFGPYWRDCRAFLRVVVRSDGFERRYRGTACRNPSGSWWIVSSARVF